MTGSICFLSFNLLIYSFILKLTSLGIVAIICLLHYSYLSVMMINVWHSVEHWHIHWPVVCTAVQMQWRGWPNQHY